MALSVQRFDELRVTAVADVAEFASRSRIRQNSGIGRGRPNSGEFGYCQEYLSHTMNRLHSSELPSAPKSSGPRLQFGLRALFGFVSAAAVVCFLMTVVSPLWGTIVGWFLLLVIGHVLGNWWGSTVGRGPTTAEQLAERPPRAGPPAFAPPSRLQHHVVLGATPFVSAALSAAVGSALGTWFILNRPEQPSWTGLFVGLASAAVLGGFFGFLVSSFLSVGLRALREATAGRVG